MIWLLSLLVIFWKPVYYLVRYAIATKNKDSINQSYYISQTKSWFSILWVLLKPIKPEGVVKNAAKEPEQNPQSNA